jgi:hypothetical protein
MKRVSGLAMAFLSKQLTFTTTIMKNKVHLLLLIMIALTMAAQAQVTVSLTLRPPYSAYIKDYYHLENKAVIVLTNTTRLTQDIKLGGSISNQSRGVYIRTTPDYQPASPITLGPGATQVLTANADLMRFFDQGNITTNANDAMLASIIRSGTLPEGTYQLCVHAYDYNTGRQLSPTGMGCFSFDLSLADPPLITFPQNNYVYPAEQKNLNFSWTPPLGNLAGSLIEYDQVVVKVQAGQNPNDAVAAARDFKAGNPKLDKKGTLSQTYITQPYDLPFEPGTYAMQVVAKDRNQKVLLNNQGRSEIVVFEVGKGTKAPVDDLEFSENTNSNTWTMSQLKGTLRYYWANRSGGATYYNNHGNYSTPPADNNNNSSGNNSGSGSGLHLEENNNQVSLLRNTSGFTSWQNNILSGVTVQLVTATMFTNPVSSGSGGPTLLPGNVVAGTTVLATATTTSSGKFTFNVPNLSSIDFGWKNNVVSGGSNEFAWSISGPHKTVLMIKITSGNYYAQPIQYLMGIPDNKEMGTFYSRVITFDCKVSVAESNHHSQKKSGVEVLFMRKNPKGLMVPRDEGSPGTFQSNEHITVGGTSYEVVYKGVTGNNGEITVPNIVVEPCMDGNTPYYVYSRIPNQYATNDNLVHTVRNYRLGTQSQWENSSCTVGGGTAISPNCAKDNCFSFVGTIFSYSEQTFQPRTYYHIQGVSLDNPRVYGQVKNAAAGEDNAQNQANARWCVWRLNSATVEKAKQIAADGKWGLLAESSGGFSYLMTQLYEKGTPLQLQRTGLTGSNGRIDEELPYEGDIDNPTGYYYIVTVEKTGYDLEARVIRQLSNQPAGAGDVGIAKPGVAYDMGDIWLQPKGKVVLKLVNEHGNVIGGKAWYYDPATGQDGQVEQALSTIAGQPDLRRVRMDIPSGNNRKIVVQPANEDLYEMDTITVDVSATETLHKDVVVKYKLHRIYFNVKGPNDQRLDRARVELILVSGAADMYNGLQSPWLYEGAHSNMPPPNLPVQPNNNPPDNNQSNNNSGNNYINTNDLPEIVGPYTKFTNNGGGVDFAFKNSDTVFKFRITGPDGTSYVVKERYVYSPAGKTWKKVNVTLAPARTVKGTVKFGQVPVAQARVRVKGSSPLIEVFTNSQGEYIMKGVPLDTNLTFTASKSGYIGMEFTEGQSTQNVYGMVNYVAMLQEVGERTTTINFKLRIYDGLDLSRLLGFPLEVTELEETAGAGTIGRGGANNSAGQQQSQSAKPVRISGVVRVSDAENTVFKMDGTTAQGKKLSTIDFSDLLVVADDIKNDSLVPYCRPQTLPVKTDINQQPVLVYNFYQGTMYDNTNGITLNNYTSNNKQQGVAQARVRIESSSFSDNSIALENGQPICLVNNTGNGNSMQFPVFTSSGLSVVSTSQGIGIGNSNGEALHYTLHDFTAIAAPGTSRLYKDSVVLDTRLQTSLEHVQQSNLNLPIGRVIINHDRELADLNRAINVNMPLGSFNLNWNRIYINDQGVKFDAVLNAAGMNMPVSKATLYPDRFQVQQGTLQTSNVKLLNAVPVTVHNNASFGYDATYPVPSWYLSITSEDNDVTAAEISGQYLDGLSSNDVIPLTSLWFYSNGDQSVTLSNNIPAYRLYNITNFTLQSLILNPNLIELAGSLDLGIPGFATYNTALGYNKTSNTTISGMVLQPFSMPDIPVNGVVFGFNDQSSNSIQFSNGQLQVRGTIRDENPDVFRNVWYTLTKTSQETALVLDRAPQTQSIKLGGSNSNSRLILSNIEGRMWVTNNAWNHLYINGDMPEEMGFTADGKRMRFDVLGNLSVSNQSVKLKNMETPFGNLSMQYDMSIGRLMGNLHFANKAGSVAVQGDAEIVMDKLGYYFMAGGSMEMHNPKVKGQTYMLFGDYDHRNSDRLPAIENMLKEYSYYYQNMNELPKGYANMNQLSGFFFEGGAEIPFPLLPNFDVDLVMVSAALEVNVGGDVRMGMSFGDVNMYNLGLGVFVNARLKLGASIGVACAGVEVWAKAGIDIDGTYYSNGNYDLEVIGYITLKGRAWAGGGLFCTSDCDGACISDEISGQIGVKAIGTVTQNDSHFELIFDTTNNTFKN